jgi:hypothetical protein
MRSRIRRSAVALAGSVTVMVVLAASPASAATPVRMVRLTRDVSAWTTGAFICPRGAAATNTLSYSQVFGQSSQTGNARGFTCQAGNHWLGLVAGDIASYDGNRYSSGYHLLALLYSSDGGTTRQVCSPVRPVPGTNNLYGGKAMELRGTITSTFGTSFNQYVQQYRDDFNCPLGVVKASFELTEGWRAE